MIALVWVATSGAILAHPASTELAEAARGFLAALTPEQRAKTLFEMGDAERENWHFVPKTRAGLTLKEMTPAQQEKAMTLVKTGLSARGHARVESIMSLEAVLKEIEGRDMRDAGLYTFAVFGNPDAKGVWSWRFEGHHISINFTLVGDIHLSTTPSFLGANPAEVRTGPKKGLRALAEEEDLARELLALLTPDQKKIAILNARVPRDIITGNQRQITLQKPDGLSVARMTPEQSEKVQALIELYIARYRSEAAAVSRQKIQAAGWPAVHFAWIGSEQRGEPHYYRIQGSTFLIEYDNVQNDANHIHTVWRDADGDFGRDLLREHYERAHTSDTRR